MNKSITYHIFLTKIDIPIEMFIKSENLKLISIALSLFFSKKQIVLCLNTLSRAAKINYSALINNNNNKLSFIRDTVQIHFSLKKFKS